LQDDFNLFVIEGYGHKEIAVMLNISEGTSKSQLNASKTKLKELVNNLYYKSEIVMDNQEKYSKIKNASQKKQKKNFPAMKSLDASEEKTR
jgi:hypothetical protein